MISYQLPGDNMSTNPDINRLSLEERIKRLETRFPVVGSAMPFDIPTPEEWDSATKNAATDIGKGIILKIDVDNTSSIPNISNVPNCAVYIYLFFPRVNGIVFKESMLLLKAYKMFTGTNSNYGLLANGELNINHAVLADALRFPTRGGPFDVVHVQNFWHYTYNQSTSLYTLTAGNFKILSQGNTTSKLTVYLTMQGFAGTTSSTQCTFGCVMFPCPLAPFGRYAMCPNVYPIFGGGPTCGLGQTTTTPQQLDNDLKRIYPPSWYA